MDTEICEFDRGMFFVKDDILTTRAREGARLTKEDITMLVNFLIEYDRKNVPLLVDGANSESISFDYLMAAKEILSNYVSALAYVSDDNHFISSIRCHIEPGHIVSEGQRVRIFAIKDEAIKWLRTQKEERQPTPTPVYYS